MGSILYLKQCPPSGGDTLFANTTPPTTRCRIG